MADLITNRPGGLARATGVANIERQTFRLQLRVLSDGQPVDLSAYTVDYAQIDSAIDGSLLIDLGVQLGADGVVDITGNLGTSTETTVPHEVYPNGRPAVLTVRLLDPSTFPFYLIRPSTITIDNAPGAST